MAYAIMRIEKVKTISQMTNRDAHNMRKKGLTISDQVATKPKEIIQERNMTYSEFFKEKTKEMKVRKDAVRGLECLLTFSPGGVSTQNLNEWKEASKQWLIDTFGKENIFSCTLHTSEQTPHIHALIIPIRDGKLNAKKIVGNKSNLRRLQDEYAERVSFLGLKRGIDKKITNAHHQNSFRWHSQNAKNHLRLETYEHTFGQEHQWDERTQQIFRTNQEILGSEEIGTPQKEKDIFDELF